MNFGEALDSSLVKKYKTFGGRACRAEWYYFQIFSVLLAVIVASVTGIIAGTSIDPNAIRDLSQEELTDYLVDSGSFNVVIYSTVAISALLFLPSISVTVRPTRFKHYLFLGTALFHKLHTGFLCNSQSR